MFTHRIELNGDNTGNPRPSIGERVTCRFDFLSCAAISSFGASLALVHSDPNAAASIGLSYALGFTAANSVMRWRENRVLKQIFGENHGDLHIIKEPAKAGQDDSRREEIKEKDSHSRNSMLATCIASIAYLAYEDNIPTLGNASLDLAIRMTLAGVMVTVAAREFSSLRRFDKLTKGHWSIEDHPPPLKETHLSRARSWSDKKNLEPAIINF